MGDHGARLLDLVAFLLEGVLHVLDASSELCWLQLVKFLNSVSEFLEISRALLVLRTAVLELLFEFRWVKFVGQETLHLVLVDVLLLLGLPSSRHSI